MKLNPGDVKGTDLKITLTIGRNQFLGTQVGFCSNPLEKERIVVTEGAVTMRLWRIRHSKNIHGCLRKKN